MNRNLVSLALETKQLEKDNKTYVLDFDNVIVATEKQDAKMSYKGIKGYHPNIAFVGRIPVHIENHNGNTPARYAQAETLKRCFENLEEQHICIAHFRADSASYQKEVISLVPKKWPPLNNKPSKLVMVGRRGIWLHGPTRTGKTYQALENKKKS